MPKKTPLTLRFDKLQQTEQFFKGHYVVTLYSYNSIVKQEFLVKTLPIIQSCIAYFITHFYGNLFLKRIIRYF